MLPLFLLGIICHLQASTFEINKDHSRISFKIPYMTFSEAEGIFTDYVAEIDYDQEKRTLKKVNAKIQASSINTQDKRRDAHLKKSDFLYVEKFPFIKFESRIIKQVEPQKYDVEGILEIRGIQKTIHLLTEFKGEKRDHVGKNSLFFKAFSKINRKDFGITWNKSLDKTEYLLGDELTIILVLQAQPQGKKTAFASHMIPSNPTLENYARVNRGEISSKLMNMRPIEKTLPPQAKQEMKKTSKITPQNSETPLPWLELIVGFLGFIFLIFISYFVKLALIKLFKQNQYSESGVLSLFGDGLIIGLTFLYSVWYFNYLYP